MQTQATLSRLAEVDIGRIIAKHAPGLAGAFGTFFSGLAALIDDLDDFGKFDHVHHWSVGLIGVIGGLILICLMLWVILEDIREEIEKIRRWR